MANDKENKSSDGEAGYTWERHSQTIMAGLVLAGIMFLYSSVDISGKAVVKMQGDLKLVQQSVGYLQDQIKAMDNQQYSAQDASKDYRLFNVRLDSCERRVSAIESALHKSNKE